MMRKNKMHAYVVYAHPSKSSFTYEVLNSFLNGVKESGNTFEIGNLYEMNFECKLDLDQYMREVSRMTSTPVPGDVAEVWTNGYAYFYDENVGRKSFIKPKKALVICTAGHTVEYLEETGIAKSMRCIMLKDRLNNVGFTDVNYHSQLKTEWLPNSFQTVTVFS